MNRDFINVNKIRMKIHDDLINRITKVKFLSTLFSLLRYWGNKSKYMFLRLNINKFII